MKGRYMNVERYDILNVSFGRFLTGRQIAAITQEVIRKGRPENEFTITDHTDNETLVTFGQRSPLEYEGLRIAPTDSSIPYINFENRYNEISVVHHTWGSSMFGGLYDPSFTTNAIQAFSSSFRLVLQRCLHVGFPDYQVLEDMKVS
jgi:hypothetical protein